MMLEGLQRRNYSQNIIRHYIRASKILLNDFTVLPIAWALDPFANIKPRSVTQLLHEGRMQANDHLSRRSGNLNTGTA